MLNIDKLVIQKERKTLSIKNEVKLSAKSVGSLKKLPVWEEDQQVWAISLHIYGYYKQHMNFRNFQVHYIGRKVICKSSIWVLNYTVNWGISDPAKPAEIRWNSTLVHAGSHWGDNSRENLWRFWSCSQISTQDSSEHTGGAPLIRKPGSGRAHQVDSNIMMNTGGRQRKSVLGFHTISLTAVTGRVVNHLEVCCWWFLHHFTQTLKCSSIST